LSPLKVSFVFTESQTHHNCVFPLRIATCDRTSQMSYCASHPEFSNKSLRGGKAVFEPAPVKKAAAILGILEAA